MPAPKISWKLTAGLLAAAALVVILLGPTLWDASDRTGGTLTLPDGGSYAIPAMEFTRPDLRNSEGLHKQWQEAGAAYQTGDYTRSERLFGEIEGGSGADPSRHDAALYRGISLVMSGRHQQADDVLQRARGFAEQSGLGSTVDSYYLGIAALGRNDLATARTSLQQALGGPFDQQARNLLAGI